MKFHYATLENCSQANGFVVVIDVIRAFTNAAFIFSRGAQKIIPIRTVEEALQLKQEDSNRLVCGEVGGIPPAGFDFGNSPSQVLGLDLNWRAIVQRTGAGTQGIVRSLQAKQMAAASFVVAAATAKYIQRFAPEQVTFVVTGYDDFGKGGDEDLACAEYLEALLKRKQPNAEPFLERVRKSRDASYHFDSARPEFPAVDIDYCTSLDRFDFAMPVIQENGHFVIQPVYF